MSRLVPGIGERTDVSEMNDESGLVHVCKTHTGFDFDGSLLNACEQGIGCASYCGLSLTSGPVLSSDPDEPVMANDCVVCQSMWWEENR